MSTVTQDNSTVPTHLRGRMEKAVEQLLAALDALESAEEDLEEVDHGGPDVDAELSWRESAGAGPAISDMRAVESYAATDDDEPSLGSLTSGSASQGMWSSGSTDDTEDEHDGAEPDVDGEPSLGAFDRVIDQSKSWTQRLGPSTWHAAIDAELDDADREDDDPAGDIADLEPSLGWPERFSVEGGTMGAFHDGEQA